MQLCFLKWEIDYGGIFFNFYFNNQNCIFCSLFVLYIKMSRYTFNASSIWLGLLNSSPWLSMLGSLKNICHIIPSFALQMLISNFPSWIVQVIESESKMFHSSPPMTVCPEMETVNSRGFRLTWANRMIHLQLLLCCCCVSVVLLVTGLSKTGFSCTGISPSYYVARLSKFWIPILLKILILLSFTFDQ